MPVDGLSTEVVSFGCESLLRLNLAIAFL